MRQDITTRSLANGVTLDIPVFHFTGSDPAASTLYLQSSVHAAEVQGYWVALKLIEFFSAHPPLGDVTIVPLANPYGLNSQFGGHTLGRFDLSTGDNWNRNYLDLSDTVDDFLAAHGDCDFSLIIDLFKSHMLQHIQKKQQRPNAYHDQLALQLQGLAMSADVVLDLHCDTRSIPHVYSTGYALETARCLDFPVVIDIPEVFAGALDEAVFCPWVKLTARYNEQHGSELVVPVQALTIELGSEEHIDAALADEQVTAILRCLLARGVIDQASVLDDQVSCVRDQSLVCALGNFKSVYAPVGGLVVSSKQPGERVQRGDILLSISVLSRLGVGGSDVCGESLEIIYAEGDGIVVSCASGVVVHEGMVLMKLAGF